MYFPGTPGHLGAPATLRRPAASHRPVAGLPGGGGPPGVPPGLSVFASSIAATSTPRVTHQLAVRRLQARIGTLMARPASVCRLHQAHPHPLSTPTPAAWSHRIPTAVVGKWCYTLIFTRILQSNQKCIRMCVYIHANRWRQN